MAGPLGRRRGALGDARDRARDRLRREPPRPRRRPLTHPALGRAAVERPPGPQSTPNQRVKGLPLSPQHPPRQDLKAIALDTAARGWPVFPTKPRSTDPAVRAWRQKATTDFEPINRAWDHNPEYNVGLLPCPSGLIVLDLIPARNLERPPLTHRAPGVHDGADVLAALTEAAGARFPTETMTVMTPGGGIQLYFQHPQGRPCPQASPGTDSPLGWHVAIRSADSYVLAPGSVTPDGPYSIGHDASPAPWPSYLASHLSTSLTSEHCTSHTPHVRQGPRPTGRPHA
ncbi:bifunctional DNA primase/polymerase [Streptomyces abikoensis]|uniref:bifunctional DNA primase/polymerase n=1 Tax=Streptomyces abikoensis TaxID=97398 RepID=UPI0033EBED87